MFAQSRGPGPRHPRAPARGRAQPGRPRRRTRRPRPGRRRARSTGSTTRWRRRRAAVARGRPPRERPSRALRPRSALAVLCVSVGSIFVRLAEAPALAVAFHRIFLASLVLAPFAAAPLARAWPASSSRRRLHPPGLRRRPGAALRDLDRQPLLHVGRRLGAAREHGAPVHARASRGCSWASAPPPSVLVAIGAGPRRAPPHRGRRLGRRGAASLRGRRAGAGRARSTLSLYHVDRPRPARRAAPRRLRARRVGHGRGRRWPSLAACAARSRSRLSAAHVRWLFWPWPWCPPSPATASSTARCARFPRPRSACSCWASRSARRSSPTPCSARRPGASTLAGGALVLAALALVVRERGAR